MEKGARVKSKRQAIGKTVRMGTVVGELAGFILVRWDGLDRDYAYLVQEIEPWEESNA